MYWYSGLAIQCNYCTEFICNRCLYIIIIISTAYINDEWIVGDIWNSHNLPKAKQKSGGFLSSIFGDPGRKLQVENQILSRQLEESKQDIILTKRKAYTDLQIEQNSMKEIEKSIQVVIESCKQEIQEYNTRLQETQSQLQESDTRFQETQFQLQESDIRLQETQSQLQESDARLQETQSKLQESNCRLQETQSQLRQANIRALEMQQQIQVILLSIIVHANVLIYIRCQHLMIKLSSSFHFWVVTSCQDSIVVIQNSLYIPWNTIISCLRENKYIFI